MKVYNLRCCNDHRFEGWFASERDYETQSEEGLLACPVCGELEVRKMPSAPRLNLGGAEHNEAQPRHADVQQAWLEMARRILESTEDVGKEFAEEARRMHYREVEARPIRGTTTAEQFEELTDEGIDVVSFPIPPGLKQTLQ